jgi:glycosyltransferase involved in cell wall biosynthesis
VSEKTVLIITYYWPPSGGSGVQRWLKFVKYLPEYGYTPYVFTPQNPSFDLKDESLLHDVPNEAEVIHFPIWEPYQLFFKASRAMGSDANDKTSNLISSKNKTLFQRLSTWLRGNLLIPDPRVFWVRPSVKFLDDFLKDKGIRTIVTTGPPHSLHLIGLALKKRNPGLKWIADFRDPWSTWGLLDSLNAGKVARSAHRYLEKKVLQRADRIVTITPFYVRKFGELSGRKVELLTNGYDETDFKSLSIQRSDEFLIRHVGIVNEKCDPRPVMLSVKALVRDDDAFASKAKVEFIGDVHPDFKAFVLADDVLRRVVIFTPPVPHKQLMKYYGSSALLLLVLAGYKDAEGYMPGKLFEYLATGLPVLGVGPEQGDAASIIQSAGAGKMIDASRANEISAFIKIHFDRWNSNALAPQIQNGFMKFTRRAITKELAQLLDSLR